MGPSWGHLGPSWCHHGAIKTAKYARHLGESTICSVPGGHLEAILGLLGVISGPCWRSWGAILEILRQKWRDDGQTSVLVGDLEAKVEG